MAAALQIHVSGMKSPVTFRPVTKQTPHHPNRSAGRIRCAATTPEKRYTIAVLPGDGIGTEVTPVAIDALRLAGSQEGIEFVTKEMPVGGAAYELTGVPLPDETLQVSLQSDAVYLGAVGITKKMPSSDHLPKQLKPEGGLLKLRKALQVYANLRPITVYPQLLEASSLKRHVAEGVDLMIVRELNGGLYGGQPRGFGTNEQGEEIGYCTEVYSRSEVDRIARVAFDTAVQRRSKLCSVDKATILEASMLWRRRVTVLSAEYPDVDLSHLLVDTSAMELLREPKQFDVILTNNVFGDILSDVAAMITGGIGMLPSACIGGPGPALFEPVHGSAPDIDGEDIANPLASVLTVVMLLRYGLKEEGVAKRIEDAVSDTLSRGFRTRDIHTPGTTLVGCKRMGEEILKSLYTRVPTLAYNN